MPRAVRVITTPCDAATLTRADRSRVPRDSTAAGGIPRGGLPAVEAPRRPGAPAPAASPGIRARHRHRSGHLDRLGQAPRAGMAAFGVPSRHQPTGPTRALQARLGRALDPLGPSRPYRPRGGHEECRCERAVPGGGATESRERFTLHVGSRGRGRHAHDRRHGSPLEGSHLRHHPPDHRRPIRTSRSRGATVNL